MVEKRLKLLQAARHSLMKSQINDFLRTLQPFGHARTSFRRNWYSIPAKSCRLMRPLRVPTVIRSSLACRNAVVLSEVSAIWGQSCRFYGPTCFRFRSMMTMFRHSDCRLDHGARFKSWFIRGGKGEGGQRGIRLIGASGTRWILMLMRERSREDNTSTRKLPGHLYTPCVPYSVFRQVN